MLSHLVAGTEPGLTLLLGELGVEPLLPSCRLGAWTYGSSARMLGLMPSPQRCVIAWANHLCPAGSAASAELRSVELGSRWRLLAC